MKASRVLQAIRPRPTTSGSRLAAHDATPGLGRTGRLVVATILLVSVLRSISNPFPLVFTLTYGTVGGLLAIRRPRNTLGWLLLAIAFGFASIGAVPSLDVGAINAGTAPLADDLLVWIGGWAAYMTWAGLVALMVLFPSGRLPAGRWRPAAIALIASAVLLGVLTAAAPRLSFNPGGQATSLLIRNPFAVLPDLPIWGAFPVDRIVVATVALLATGIVSMVVRFARSSGLERLQLRWLVAALASVVVAVGAGLAGQAVFGDAIGGAAWIPAVAAYPTVPIAIYVAATRYRLYEIDRIISRTIGWLLVTLVLAAVFGLAVVATQTLLASVTQGQTLAVAASTLAVAALFQPLRRRIQRLVDRRFDRTRYDADRIASAFAVRIRDQVDLRRTSEALVATAVGAVLPMTCQLWLREHRDARP